MHLCSLLLDAATPLVVSSLQNDSLEAVRRIHRSYRQQAGLHSPPVAADSELTSSASEGTQRTSDDSGVAGGGAGTSYVSPVIIRAAAWIVGEFRGQIRQVYVHAWFDAYVSAIVVTCFKRITRKAAS